MWRAEWTDKPGHGHDMDCIYTLSLFRYRAVWTTRRSASLASRAGTMVSSVINCSSGNQCTRAKINVNKFDEIQDKMCKPMMLSEPTVLTRLYEVCQPELRVAPDLAVTAEKPTSTCTCSQEEFSFPHYFCLTDCHPLPLHPRADLVLFDSPFLMYCISLITQSNSGRLNVQCCSPFKKWMTLPHLPASKGCSFSRPMKVMLYVGE